MKKILLSFALIFVVGVLVVNVSTVLANPDPCLSLYPTNGTIYHYDTAEYYTVMSGHPLYDPFYDRGGQVLLEVGTDIVDPSIYQAPGLSGFTPSTGGNDGFFAIGNDITLVVDGWNNTPITYTNVLLVFEADPADPNLCDPQNITVDGNPVVLSSNQLDHYYSIGDLVVQTPTPDGNNYSDTSTHAIHWEGCPGIMIWAFSDPNFDAKRTGGECFSAFSHDVTIPTHERTWGAVKELYKD